MGRCWARGWTSYQTKTGTEWVKGQGVGPMGWSLCSGMGIIGVCSKLYGGGKLLSYLHIQDFLGQS